MRFPAGVHCLVQYFHVKRGKQIELPHFSSLSPALRWKRPGGTAPTSFTPCQR